MEFISPKKIPCTPAEAKIINDKNVRSWGLNGFISNEI